MRIVLLGFPGSGKGTQAKLMAEKYRVPQISTGDILRAAVADKTEIGKKVAAVMAAGELVSDDIVIDAVTDRVRSAESRRGFVLDGFPRSIPQAQELDTRLGWMSRSLQLVLHFALDHDAVVKRITGRLTCSKCGEPMRIIAFITDSHEVAKILEHNGEQTSRAPPLTPTDPVSSSCDFDDTNFQYPEVPWYPNPPALDF